MIACEKDANDARTKTTTVYLDQQFVFDMQPKHIDCNHLMWIQLLTRILRVLPLSIHIAVRFLSWWIVAYLIKEDDSEQGSMNPDTDQLLSLFAHRR